MWSPFFSSAWLAAGAGSASRAVAGGRSTATASASSINEYLVAMVAPSEVDLVPQHFRAGRLQLQAQGVDPAIVRVDAPDQFPFRVEQQPAGVTGAAGVGGPLPRSRGVVDVDGQPPVRGAVVGERRPRLVRFTRQESREED